jgi:TPP-dependent indolepyruvate ferredoxin oxidoreductase alpha subunit
VPDVPPRAVISPRIRAAGLPATDPACAGCAQLGTFRALRRAGLAVQGGLGCDAGAAPSFRRTQGRWAAMVPASRVLAMGAREILDAAARAGAALVTVADDAAERAGLLEDLLAGAGARVLRVEPADALSAEGIIARAARDPGTVVLAIAPCTRDGARRAPVQVSAPRCNRCGACLSLACPAIRDGGGESVRIEPQICSGCGQCLPLCRGRALTAAERDRAR